MSLFSLSAVVPDFGGAAATLPPNVWRADQMGSYASPVVASGHALLDAELPGGGWPTGMLVELLLPRNGIGELALLQPALKRIAQKRMLTLVQPPLRPQPAAWHDGECAIGHLTWIRAERNADAQWAAEQVLRNGSAGALLLWQTQIRHEALRRLQLAAQASDLLFWLVRPQQCAREASPAPLRLALQPANGGINVEILKRRGPRRAGAFFVPLAQLPALHPSFAGGQHAPVDQRLPATPAARNIPPALV